MNPEIISALTHVSWAFMMAGVFVIILSSHVIQQNNGTIGGGNDTKLKQSNSNTVNGTIAGSISAAGAILLMMYIKYTQAGTNMVTISSLLPLIVLCVACIVLASMYIVYSNIISDGNITNQYNVFSRISAFLIMLQSILAFQILAFFKSSVWDSVSVLLGIVNIILLIIMWVSLKYYATDGFANLMTFMK